MKSIYLVSVVMIIAAGLAPASAAKRVPAAECRALFAKVDRNGDGSLTKSENVQFYLNRITLGESSNLNDFIMSRATFVWHCERGMFPRG
jgi:hypothetical protein